MLTITRIGAPPRNARRSLAVAATAVVTVATTGLLVDATSGTAATRSARVTTTTKARRTRTTLRTTTAPPMTVPVTATTVTATTVPATPAALRPATTVAPKPLTGTLDVFAASSLTAAFTDIGQAFEKTNPSVHIRLNTAGSSTLVTQILSGATADVLATADTANMDRVRDAKLLDGSASVFARNTPMIVVPRGNPLRVRTLADLARPEVFVALGAPGVPVGDYSREILRRAGVDVTPKTLEANVKAIVNKAALKEIDAGIVYVTDVDIDEYRVDGVAIPANQNVIAAYPIAALKASDHIESARAFVAFAQASAAQSILAKYKFLPPT